MKANLAIHLCIPTERALGSVSDTYLFTERYKLVHAGIHICSPSDTQVYRI